MNIRNHDTIVPRWYSTRRLSTKVKPRTDSYFVLRTRTNIVFSDVNRPPFLMKNWMIDLAMRHSEMEKAGWERIGVEIEWKE